MACEPRVNFSMRELDRLKCIQTVIDGDLKPGQAAERLDLTVRQTERLVNRYRARRSAWSDLQTPQSAREPGSEATAD
jgi:hypothetical protein